MRLLLKFKKSGSGKHWFNGLVFSVCFPAFAGKTAGVGLFGFFVVVTVATLAAFRRP